MSALFEIIQIASSSGLVRMVLQILFQIVFTPHCPMVEISFLGIFDISKMIPWIFF